MLLPLHLSEGLLHALAEQPGGAPSLWRLQPQGDHGAVRGGHGHSWYARILLWHFVTKL